MLEQSPQQRVLKTKTMNWCLAQSPDGKHIASGGADRDIQIWELESTLRSGVLSGHRNDVFAIDYSPTGEALVSGSSDKTVRIWNPSTFQQTSILIGHKNWVTSVQYSPDGQVIASGGYDNLIKLWSSSLGQQLASLEHSSPVCSIKYRTDGLELVSGGFNDISIWDTQSNSKTCQLTDHKGSITSLAYSPDNSIIASGGMHVHLWDAKSQQQIKKIAVKDKVNDIKFSNDGTQLILSTNKNIEIFDMNTFRNTQTLDYHQQTVTSLQLLKNTQSIISCCLGKKIIYQSDYKLLKQNQEIVKPNNYALKPLQLGRIAKVQNKELVKTNNDELKPKKASQIASVQNKEVNKNNNAEWKTIKVGHLVSAMALSPDGKYIASIGSPADENDYSIRIWDPVTGKQRGNNLQGHQGILTQVHYSKNGDFLVTACWFEIRVWDMKTIKEVKLPYPITFEQQPSENVSVGLSQHDKYIVFCEHDGKVRFANSQTGQELINKRMQEVDEIILSPKTTEIACIDGNIKIWDYEKEQETRKIIVRPGRIGKFSQYSSDGQLFLSDISDENKISAIVIWNLSTGEQICKKILNTADRLTQLYLSPNMQQILTIYKEKIVQILKFTGKEISQTVFEQEQSVFLLSANYSLDGRFILIGDHKANIQVMKAPVT